MSIINVYKNYNSYFNRTVKLDEANDRLIYTQSSVNFNPNDGVSTTFVLGSNNDPYDGLGDYIFVTDDDGTNATHWFLMEAVRIRKGQYRVTLRRDVLRDFNDQIKNSIATIKRGYITNESPFIFNKEPFSYNQIKEEEILLKDDTGVAWICGFISKNSEEKEITYHSTVAPDYTTDSLSNFAGYENTGQNGFAASGDLSKTSVEILVHLYSKTGEPQGRAIRVPIKVVISENTVTGVITIAPPTTEYENFSKTDSLYGLDIDIIPYSNTTLTSEDITVNETLCYKFQQAYGNISYLWAENVGAYGTEQAGGLEEYDGKILYVEEEDSYYKMDLEYFETNGTRIVEGKPSLDKGFYSYIENLVLSLSPYNLKTGSLVLVVTGSNIKSRLKFTKILNGEYRTTIPASNARYENKDAPFDVFCIPYGQDVYIKFDRNGREYSFLCNKQFSLTTASALGQQLGTFIYDIQLLPYCPFTGYVKTTADDGKPIIKILDGSAERITVINKDEDGNGTFVDFTYAFIWSAKSSGTKNISLPIDQIFDLKIENETVLYRLVSPNYNGQFEFSVAKNGGSVEYFNVDFTYLPYSSYIHVNPNFSRLYGKDYNDSRGLICQGDFSIMYTSDAWVQYQINNKNYDNIFNRQIQNMDVTRKYERIDQVANVTANAISAGLTTGLVTGNLFAGLGAGIASAGAGAADIAISEKLFSENKDYAKDLYNYNLANVQALPYSIAKTTAYHENNKVFPLLERYGCTQEERNALEQYIINYGMNIGVIGKVGDYMLTYPESPYRGYISAELIKIEGVGEDDHVINAIASEMSKGWYQK